MKHDRQIGIITKRLFLLNLPKSTINLHVFRIKMCNFAKNAAHMNVICYIILIFASWRKDRRSRNLGSV